MPNTKLLDYILADNVADLLSGEKLKEIADEVIKAHERDEASLVQWRAKAKLALELAGMDGLRTSLPDDENFKSDVKSPLIARAAIVFASNTMPEIVQDSKVAKATIYGADPDGSKAQKARNSLSALNYMLLNPHSTWKDDLRKSLTMLAVTGCVIRKVEYDPVAKETRTTVVDYDDVSYNASCKSIYGEDCRAITQKLRVHNNILETEARSGRYLELPKEEYEEEPNYYDDLNRDNYHCLLEQHCWLDLDEDGYEEPYIVVLHESKKYVLSIRPRYDLEDIVYKKDEDGNDTNKVIRIVPEQYFVMLKYYDSFDNTLPGIGLGTLLISVHATHDTVINQLIDSGRRSNEATLFMDAGLNNKQKDMRIKYGAINRFDFAGRHPSEGIWSLDFKEPSSTLYQLMGYLDTYAKELSSTTDAVTGSKMPSNIKTGAVNTITERSLKPFADVLDRITGALSIEFNINYKILGRYWDNDKYIAFLDDENANLRKDFDLGTMDVYPVADPDMSTESARIQKAQALLQVKDDPQLPAENRLNIIREYLEALGVEQVDKFVPDPKNAEQNPEVIKLQQENQKLMQNMQQLQQSHDLQVQKLQQDREKTAANMQIKIAQLEQKAHEAENKHSREMIEMAIAERVESMKADAKRRDKSENF